jgi:glutamate synthase (NADPH/NADH) large chain
MAPMATTGQEAIGSMGTDTPISAMSDKSKLLYTYFKQNFAQVTNPPIDPIREELVMSLVSFIGPRPNLFDLEGPSKRKRLEVRQPILTNGDLEKIRSIGTPRTVRHQDARHDLFEADKGADGMKAALERLCDRAEEAVHRRLQHHHPVRPQVGPDRIAIPALLATAAVHHHLIRKGLRTSVGLVVESGEPREVHHFCCLAGYGAEAINPYLAFDTLLDMHARRISAGSRPIRSGRALHQGDRQGHPQGDVEDGHLDLPVLLRRADLRRGRAVEPSSTVFHRHCDHDRGRRPRKSHRKPSTVTPDAFSNDPVLATSLEVGGEYIYRMRGEDHMLDARCGGDAAARGARQMPRSATRIRRDGQRSTLRMNHPRPVPYQDAEETGRKPVPLDEVEPAAISSSGFRPARCRSARSAARRIRRWPSP